MSKLLRSILSNWAALLVSGVISIVLTPVLIEGLGDRHYGMWILVASLLEYYGLLDFGMRTTVQRFVARLHGSGDRKGLNETFSTAFGICLAVAALLLVCTGVLAIFIPRWFGEDQVSRTFLRWLTVLLGTSAALNFVARLLGSYLWGLHRFDLHNLATVGIAILRASLFVAVLYAGGGLLGLSAVTLLVSALLLGANAWLLRCADPGLSPAIAIFRRDRARELAGFSFFVFLNMLGGYLRFYTDSIVIARVLTIDMIAPFNVASRLMELFRTMLFALTNPLMSGMSELDRADDNRAIQELFLRATRVTALLTLCIGSLIFLHGKSILLLWVGERFLGSYPLLTILLLGYVVALAQSPSMMALMAKGRHAPMGIWTLGEGIANLLLSIVLASKYGLVGVAWGTVVPMLATKILVQPWYALHVLEVSARTYVVQSLARPVAVTAVFLALALAFGGWPSTSTATGFLVAASWQTGLFVLLAYAVALDREDRHAVRSLGRHFSGFAEAPLESRPGAETEP